ncbi:MAG: hypothetical protein PSU94_01035 [Lacunisphaera sp.]|nr:hypothetical protein [Lacunisphaera sp.]
MTAKPTSFRARLVLLLACVLIVTTYALLMDLKGISTDEGFRLWIINGGHSFAPAEGSSDTSWARVLEACRPHAYQPLYFLIQNSVMRITGGHSLIFFRSVNLAFLGLCLLGLLVLSREWRLAPRLFLLGVFSFNAYLFMHVLQIREYIAGVAFYIWSTWVVLELEQRPLARPRDEMPWFAGYGGLLALGFYVQSWVVFPAIGQFLYLLLRRTGQRPRFYAHLAFSYAIVLAATLPYLASHRQKIDVGLWASDSDSLESHLSDGFHLVLSGHLAGQSRFTDFLFYFWPAVIAGGAFLFLWDRTSSPAPVAAAESRRQGLLMILCVTVSLAFQIGYTLQVENLAVWPRYFVIHYFFLTWLIALAFRYLWELRGAAAGWARRLTLATGALAAVLAISAVYQIRSFRQDPFLDTGLNTVSNWRNVGAELARFLGPRDVVVMSDYITQSTLTATRPMPNAVLLLPDLETSDLHSADRLVYIEPDGTQTQRGELAERLQALGFGAMQERILLAPDGKTVVPTWRALIFQRP